MRVLIVTHYFPPEIGAPQARLSGLAATWAADGDEVTVLTGMPNHPTGVLPPAYRRAVRRREHRDGYRVIRTWLFATPNEGVARKTLGHLSFMASSVLLGWRASGPADVVVVSSPTFFSILSGWLLARLKRARFVVEIRDLWPAIFVELGVLTNRRVIGMLERLELAAYAAADQVVVVSEGFRADLLRRGVPPEKVHTIRNGVDLGRFTPQREILRLSVTSCERGWAPGPMTAWCCTRGRTGSRRRCRRSRTRRRCLTTPAVRRTARRQRRRPSGGVDRRAIRFAFVGDGADKQRLQRRVEELGLRQRGPAARRAQRRDAGAARGGGHLPGAAAQRAAVRDVHPVQDVRVPGRGQGGDRLGRRRGGADPGARRARSWSRRKTAARLRPPSPRWPPTRSCGRRSAALGRAFAERCYDRAALAREYRKILELDSFARAR